MLITKRTLEAWRKEALIESYIYQEKSDEAYSITKKEWLELNNRIIRMTQELLDVYLMKSQN